MMPRKKEVRLLMKFSTYYEIRGQLYQSLFTRIRTRVFTLVFGLEMEHVKQKNGFENICFTLMLDKL